MYEDNYENILNKKSDEATDSHQESAEEQQERLGRYIYLGGKLKALFWCEIISMIIYAILRVIEQLDARDVFGVVLFLAGAVLICFLLTCIITITMGRAYESFLKAGVLFLIASVLDLVSNLGLLGRLGTYTTLITTILYIVEMYYFVDGMTSALAGIDAGLLHEWENYWKMFWILLVIAIVCTLLLFIPLINLLAAMAMIVLAFVYLGFAIWRYMLLWKSADILIGYATYYGTHEE